MPNFKWQFVMLFLAVNPVANGCVTFQDRKKRTEFRVRVCVRNVQILFVECFIVRFQWIRNWLRARFIADNLRCWSFQIVEKNKNHIHTHTKNEMRVTSDCLNSTHSLKEIYYTFFLSLISHIIWSCEDRKKKCVFNMSCRIGDDETWLFHVLSCRALHV